MLGTNAKIDRVADFVIKALYEMTWIVIALKDIKLKTSGPLTNVHCRRYATSQAGTDPPRGNGAHKYPVKGSEDH